MIPREAADGGELAAVLARGMGLAKGRDPALDETALAGMEIDPTDWSDEVVEAVGASQR